MFRSLSNLLMILAMTLIAAGCATKGYVQKQISPVQSQLTAMTDELVRMDQSIQDSRGSAMQAEGRHGGAPAGGGIYRTPSGFELPSMNIQKALKNAGYYQGNVDGKIGSATEAAVKQFQKDNGLHADGIVGRNTWDKLKVYLSGIK